MRDVDTISGAFMMVRRPLALSLGGLPEEMFMYHEDVAFCLRVRRAGHRIRYLGNVTTTHHSGQSSSRSSARLGLLEAEYKYRFIREADGPLHGALARVVLGVRAVTRVIIGIVGAPAPLSLKRRYPRVFDVRLHALQLAWSVAPWTVRNVMPKAPAGE
jgi:GT2 family glycosyltransferase